MRALVAAAQDELIRNRFGTAAELVAGLYSALIEYLEHRELIRHGPFDAARNLKAALDDLDPEKIAWFVGVARGARRFPLAGDAPSGELLRHLNLLDHGGEQQAEAVRPDSAIAADLK